MGPELRSIMGATIGPNFGLASFIGDKIDRVIAKNEDTGNTCESLEELLNSIEEYNDKIIETGDDMKRMVISSI